MSQREGSDSAENKKDSVITYEPSEVRVVSFDLDNTLWKTWPTIQSANNDLAAFLKEHNIIQPKRVEVVMNELFKEQPNIYSPNANDDNIKSPTFFSLLRKDAIRKILIESNGYSEDNARPFAESSFQIWIEGRHRAITQNLASNAMECLEKIKSLRSGKSGKPVVIGAITDGNSNPHLVPNNLGKYFDFVVNAETVGVSKPDKGLYLASIKEAAKHPNLQDMFVGIDIENNDDEIIKRTVGSWWIHIGDNFLKDIVPAKIMGMRSIWSHELLGDMEEELKKAKSSKIVEGYLKKKYSTTDNEFLDNSSFETEFADATVSTFDEVGRTIERWNKEAVNIEER